MCFTCVCTHASVHVLEEDMECLPQLLTTPFLGRIPRTWSSPCPLASGTPFSAQSNINLYLCVHPRLRLQVHNTNAAFVCRFLIISFDFLGMQSQDLMLVSHPHHTKSFLFLFSLFQPPPNYQLTYLSVKTPVCPPQNNHTSLMGLINDSFLSLRVTKLAKTMII